MADNSTLRQKLIGLQDNLFNFACRLTADRDAAQDLVQDTAVRVLDNETGYTESSSFKGWVFTIMRNIFINNYRRQVLRAAAVDTTVDLYKLNLSLESGVETPEGSFAAKDISAVIGQFSYDYKEPFTMYLAGYKYGEIALKMQLPLSTVKSRIFFARRRLQSILREYR